MNFQINLTFMENALHHKVFYGVVRQWASMAQWHSLVYKLQSKIQDTGCTFKGKAMCSIHRLIWSDTICFLAGSGFMSLCQTVWSVPKMKGNSDLLSLTWARPTRQPQVFVLSPLYCIHYPKTGWQSLAEKYILQESFQTFQLYKWPIHFALHLGKKHISLYPHSLQKTR